jgi:hypothetical protein
MGKDAYCNGRKHGDDWDPSNREKIDPGPEYGGEGYCKRLAGADTDHKGEGRCAMHGGLGYRMKHGLYSKNLRGDLKETLLEARNKDTPGDQWDEVAVLRALMARYLNKIDEKVEKGGKIEADDLDAVRKIQNEIRRTIDTVHEMAMRERPTTEEVQKIVRGVGSILDKKLEGEEKEEAVEELRSLVDATSTKQITSGKP